MVKTNKKRYSQFTSFLTVLQLFNTYWWRSFTGPFFAFGFSFLIYAILGAIMDYTIMFPGIVAMTSMSNGLTGMPSSIMELKQSVLLKRIGASPIKTWTFSLVIITYYIMVSILALLYLMIWALVFTQDTSVFSHIFGGAGSFFTFGYGFIINVALGISIGFFVVSFAKSPNAAQAMGMMIYFPFTFLSGQFLSPIVIAQNDAMNYLSRAVPFRYSTMYMTEGWFGDNPFNIDVGTNLQTSPTLTPEEIGKLENDLKLPTNQLVDSIKKFIDLKTAEMNPEVYKPIDHLIGTFYPYIFIIGSLGIAIKKFRWASNR